MVEFYKSMYGTTPVIAVKPTQPEHQKNPTRVLGGMRVHGSHVKQVVINDELIDVPKIEYVRLLDEQLREAKNRVSALETKCERLNSNYIKVLSKLQLIQQGLTSKVDRR